MQLTTITLVGPSGEVDLEVPADAPVASWLDRAVELSRVPPPVGAAPWSIRILGDAPIDPALSLAEARVHDGATLYLETTDVAAPARRRPPREPLPPPPPAAPQPLDAAALAAGLGTVAVLALLALPLVALSRVSADSRPVLLGAVAVGLFLLAVLTRRLVPALVRECLLLPVPPLAGFAAAAGLADVLGAGAVLAGIGCSLVVALSIAVLGLGRACAGWVAASVLALVVAALNLASAPLLYMDAVLGAFLVVLIRRLDMAASVTAGLITWAHSTPPAPGTHDRLRLGVAVWLALVIGLTLLPLAVAGGVLAGLGAVGIAVVTVGECRRLPRLSESVGLAIAGLVGLAVTLVVGSLQLSGVGLLWQAVAFATGGGVVLLMTSAVLATSTAPTR
ncbi:MAG: EsaB/YukD family protein [Candidatus Dormibacteraeota bacterium]|nr:EsaB/YukD family protein [Candidatus Dormibacteraeota bacterium]